MTGSEISSAVRRLARDDVADGLVGRAGAGGLDAHAVVGARNGLDLLDQAVDVLAGVVGIAPQADLDQLRPRSRLRSARTLATSGSRLARAARSLAAAPVAARRSSGSARSRRRGPADGRRPAAGRPSRIADAGVGAGERFRPGHRTGGDETGDEQQPEHDTVFGRRAEAAAQARVTRASSRGKRVRGHTRTIALAGP